MDKQEQQSEATTNRAISKRLVLGCGALVHELVALTRQTPELKEAITLQCLPAKLHNTPQLIAGEVEKHLSKNAHKYDDIFVAYGDCGTAGALDAVLEKYNAQRVTGAHCYEFFAGSQAYEDIVEDQLGSFFLTDYLVRNFDRLVVEGLGLDRFPELFDAYFKHYTQMVYLAQTESVELQEMAKAHAESFGLEYKYQFVGINGLSAVTSPAIKSAFQIEVLDSSVQPINAHSPA